jgi:hypothetical protein
MSAYCRLRSPDRASGPYLPATHSNLIRSCFVSQHAQPRRSARWSDRGCLFRGCLFSTQHRDEGRVQDDEFIVYLVAVAAVLLASYLVGDAEGRGDVFLADRAWFYVTLLTIGYMISRGLAKAGSRAHDDA